jgi:hypothetical protein
MFEADARIFAAKLAVFFLNLPIFWLGVPYSCHRQDKKGSQTSR